MNNQTNTPMQNQWVIDKRIPLAVIIALLIQLASALVWAAQLDARVMRIEQQSLNQAGLNERFARLEERLDNVREDTTIVKRQLGILLERLLK